MLYDNVNSDNVEIAPITKISHESQKGEIHHPWPY